MSWETECIFLQTRQFLSPARLSSSFILQQFQENRHTPSCSEQAKSSWFNPSQLLSGGKPWHQTLFIFLSLNKPEYPGKIQELLRLFFLSASFKTSGNYPSLKPHFGSLREQDAFQFSSSSLRRLAQLLNKYWFHRQIKQES